MMKEEICVFEDIKIKYKKKFLLRYSYTLVYIVYTFLAYIFRKIRKSYNERHDIKQKKNQNFY